MQVLSDPGLTGKPLDSEPQMLAFLCFFWAHREARNVRVRRVRAASHDWNLRAWTVATPSLEFLNIPIL